MVIGHMSIHKPVLLKEVLDYLDPQSNQNFIDCTLGGGGHTLAILERTAPDGKVLAIDTDLTAIERFKLKAQSSKLKIKDRILLINDNFENLKVIYEQKFNLPISGIILDLGFSSDQLENSGQGFSFQQEEPLDMRFAQSEPLTTNKKQLTAAQIVNKWPVAEIERILRIYGEEEKARDIAAEIKRSRKKYSIETTKQLVDIILYAKNLKIRRASLARRESRRPTRKIHPATKTFQALRITVNRELEVLETVLPQALEVLAPGGHLAVISFHGLEDKIVKNYFKDQVYSNNLKIINKKPIRPKEEELTDNPRARSARLRVGKKI